MPKIIPIKNIEDTRNKVTVIDNTVTDDQYPSAKAVKDVLSSFIPNGSNSAGLISEIVDSLPSAEQAKTSVIYMVPTTNVDSQNKYDEYVYVDTMIDTAGTHELDLNMGYTTGLVVNISNTGVNFSNALSVQNAVLKMTGYDGYIVKFKTTDQNPVEVTLKLDGYPNLYSQLISFSPNNLPYLKTGTWEYGDYGDNMKRIYIYDVVVQYKALVPERLGAATQSGGVGQATPEGGEIFGLSEPTTVDLGNIAGIDIGLVELSKNEAGLLGHAEGAITKATGRAAHAEGIATTAVADGSHTEGAGTVTKGLSSHAEGFGINFNAVITGTAGNTITITNNPQSMKDIVNLEMIGRNAVVNVEGLIYYVKDFQRLKQDGLTVACILTLDRTYTGPHSATVNIHMGAALSYMSHTEGGLSTAINITDPTGAAHVHSCQHAEGHRCLSFNYAAHAEGAGTRAAGNSSHSEGNCTEALGEASHAEGLQTLANNRATHSEGFQTRALADYAHAEGANTIASGWASHAGGYDTIAGYENQTVIGCCNQNKSGTLFEIGNGNHDSGLRRNAFEVHDDGHAEVQTQGTTPNSVVTNDKFKFYNSESEIPNDLPEGTIIFILE